MSTELTNVAQIQADSRLQKPQVVLKIDGISTVYGIGPIKKYVRIGDPDLEIGGDWSIGGLNDHEDQLDIISLDGSSNTISQQLQQDKGGTSSVSSVSISLIDKDGKMTELITPGMVVDDVLGRKAEVYLGYQNTAWPQDFVRIFSGMIDEIQGGTTIILNVAHPEQKKRGEVFQNINTELTQDLYYRSKNIQHILYQTRRDVVGTVAITYSTGGTAGSETVSVAGNNITVSIQSGVSTASTIRNAIEKKQEAVALVTLKVDSGFSSETQVAGSYTLDSDLTAHVKTTQGMLLPVPSEGFRTYVRINDEVMEYTGLTDTTITGLTRGSFALVDERSEGATHETEDSVSTFYRLQGSAIDIALKVLMSGGPAYFATDIPIKSIVEVEGVGTVPNSLWFENLNVQDAYGITIGDKTSVIDDDIPANNVTDAVIQDIVATPYGSYVTLTGVTLSPNVVTAAKASFASKWNVFPEGAGLQMGGDEVDVPEFERIREIFGSSIFEYDFYLKDTVVGKEFIDTDVMFPTGCYTLPRRGKTSLGYTSPPLGTAGLTVLDSSNTSKPDQNRIVRSINKFFYNNVVFKYNEAVVDDKFLSGDISLDQDSKNRVKVNNKSLVIEARGLRPSSDTTTIMNILKKRFLDRYRFGSEKITIFGFFGKLFNSDVGDVVLYGDSSLKLPDTRQGNRNFLPRLFEIVNKSLSIKSGEVKVELLDTAYSIEDGRYGTISPSSIVGVGSTTSSIKIINSFGTVSPRIERQKWAAYVGLNIKVHDEDYTVSEEVKLVQFDASDDYVMQVEPPLSFVPAEGYIVDIADYPTNTNPEDQAVAKRVFVYTNPAVQVFAGTSTTQFSVAGADASKFLEGAIVLLHNEDWTTVSPEVHIQSVVGSDITVDESLGFTPDNTYTIEYIGFKDGGAPYRYL